MTLEIGQPTPPFTLVDQNRERVSLDDLKGTKTLLVFIPWAFSGVCSGELCQLRDQLADLNRLDANVVAITCDSFFVNKAWSKQNGFEFPILSDAWPHGAVTSAYETFNEGVGAADRSTFILDQNGILQAIVASDSLGTPREYQEYVDTLAGV